MVQWWTCDLKLKQLCSFLSLMCTSVDICVKTFKKYTTNTIIQVPGITCLGQDFTHSITNLMVNMKTVILVYDNIKTYKHNSQLHDDSIYRLCSTRLARSLGICVPNQCCQIELSNNISF